MQYRGRAAGGIDLSCYQSTADLDKGNDRVVGAYPGGQDRSVRSIRTGTCSELPEPVLEEFQRVPAHDVEQPGAAEHLGGHVLVLWSSAVLHRLPAERLDRR